MSEDPQTRHQQPPHPPTTPHPFSSPPMLPPQMQQPQQQPNPLMTQTFLAWLQYVHLQNQLNQQHHPQHHPTQQPQQQQLQGPFPYSPPHQRDVARQVPHAGSSTAGLSGAQYSAPSPSDSTRRTSPAPVGGTPELTEAEQSAVTEDKRRRNTAASARFRVKKKQWTLTLERSITDLSGRVEELEREAAELRRENGWLKEIVMLKSKRFGGPTPLLQPVSSHGTDSEEGRNSGSDGGQGASESAEDSAKDKGKGKEVAR